jgi:hypothetical protein
MSTNEQGNFSAQVVVVAAGGIAPEDAGMSRYLGLLALALSALLLVNFASDFLYARAVAAQVDDDGEPAAVAAVQANSLPLSGLIRTPTGRWGQGRWIEASPQPAVQTAESCTGSMAALQR